MTQDSYIPFEHDFAHAPLVQVRDPLTDSVVDLDIQSLPDKVVLGVGNQHHDLTLIMIGGRTTSSR